MTIPRFLDRSLDHPEETAEDVKEVSEDLFETGDRSVNYCNSEALGNSFENVGNTIAVYESVYGVEFLGLETRSPRSPERSFSDSGYLSSSPGDSHTGRHRSVDTDRDQGNDLSCALFPMRPLAQITCPLVMILDCICCKHFSADPAEGHERIMSECAPDLDRATRFTFCIFLAFCLFMLSNNFLSDGAIAVLFSVTVMFLGM